jgi:hypothetical protein
MLDSRAARRREVQGVLDGYLSEKQFAAEIRHAVRTVQRWRKRGTGPDPTVIGRNIYYSAEARARWLEARERRHHGRGRRP